MGLRVERKIKGVLASILTHEFGQKCLQCLFLDYIGLVQTRAVVHQHWSGQVEARLKTSAVWELFQSSFMSHKDPAQLLKHLHDKVALQASFQ